MRFATLILGGILFAASPLKADDDNSKDLSEIGQLNEMYVKAFNAQMPEAIGSRFTADGEFTILTGDLLSGHDQIVQGHAAFFKNNPQARVGGKQLKIRKIAPGVYLATGQWSVKNGPSAYASSGKWSTVIVNQSGEWKYEAMRLMVPAKAKAAAD